MSDHPIEQDLKTALAHLTTVTHLLDQALASSEARSIKPKHRERLHHIYRNIRSQKTLVRRLLSSIYKPTDRRLSPRDIATESASDKIECGKW